MPREKRKLSDLNTYTIILRGKSEIFNDYARSEFLKIVNKYRAIDGCKVFAYAFSNKDAYFVLREGESKVGTLVKKITVSFVRCIKSKYSNLTSVFHGRYLSEPLNTNDDILSAILNVNELSNKKTVNNYHFVSSKAKYFKNPNIDSDFVLSVTTKLKFKNAHKKIEILPSKPLKFDKYSDEQVANYIYSRYNIKASEVHLINGSKLEKILMDVISTTKSSARQLGRITKLSLRYLWGLLRKKKEDNNA